MKAFRLVLTFLSLVCGLAYANPITVKDQLLSSDPAVAQQAGAEVQKMSPGDRKVVIVSLVEGLRQSPESAMTSARALGFCGKAAQDAVNDLVEALRYDDPAVAEVVGTALVQIGPDTLRPLMRALQDSNFILRERAATVLGNMGAEAKRAASMLADLAVDPQINVQKSAKAALLKIGEPAIPALSDALRRYNGEDRNSLVIFIAEFGAPAIPVLVRSLQDENFSVRVKAINGLATIQPTDATVVPALIKTAVRDPNEYVRTAAVNALGQLGPAAKSAIGPLIRLSKQDLEALVRQRSLQALQAIGPATRDSLWGLAENFKETNAEVRQQSIGALAHNEIDPTDAASLLALGLKDADATVRMQAVQVASVWVATQSAIIATLNPSLSDSSKEVRAAAIAAMGGALSSPTDAALALQTPLKDTDPAVRTLTIDALAHLGPPAVPVLIRALLDSYPVIVEKAQSAILQMGPAAIPELEKAKAGADQVLQSRIPHLIQQLESPGKTPSTPSAPSPRPSVKKKA